MGWKCQVIGVTEDPRDLLGGESSRQPPEIGTYRHHGLPGTPPPQASFWRGSFPAPGRGTGHPPPCHLGLADRLFRAVLVPTDGQARNPIGQSSIKSQHLQGGHQWVITVPPTKRIIRRRLTTTTTTTRLGWPQEINSGRTKRDKNTPIPSDFDPQARLGWIAPRSAVF